MIYEDRSYALAGQDGEGLFSPSALGLRPVPMSTACWRGHVCEYTVLGGELVLTGLEMRVEGEPPTVFGLAPVHREGARGPRYQGLREPMRFTGRLVLGRELLSEWYVHMGFQSAWKYEEVRELVFDDGRLTEAHDRSEDAARRRRAEADAHRRRSREAGDQDRARPGPPLPPPLPAQQDPTHAWIEKSFRRDIDL
ncbi:hypothetical protein [Actinomadura logoneensis]|uniref:hypothetical protein n=1 Tax=Actinomadura logoneensis TaxID=2293572 RepID=UPI0011C1C34C|nr:hypothetical protein [Actinomadura logoneensis]